jgi:hypothetical protein
MLEGEIKKLGKETKTRLAHLPTMQVQNVIGSIPITRARLYKIF